MTLRLGALAALLVDLSLVLNTHWASVTIRNSSFRDPAPSCGLCGHCKHVMCDKHVCRQYTHTFKKKPQAKNLEGKNNKERRKKSKQSCL